MKKNRENKLLYKNIGLLQLRTVFIVILICFDCVFLLSSCDRKGSDQEPTFVYHSKNHNGVFDSEKGSSGELWAEVDYADGDLNISNITVKYSISHFFGEPTRKAVMKWEGSGSIGDIKWAGQLLDNDGQAIMYNDRPVYCSYLVGTINGPGEGYGWDVTGSPSWEELFVYLDNETLETSFDIPAADAKSLYIGDFVLGNLTILEVNRKKLNKEN